MFRLKEAVIDIPYEEMLPFTKSLKSLSSHNVELLSLLAARSLSIFEVFEKYLPQGKNVKILSLGCGLPVEYLALWAWCERNKKTTIDYTGIDINEVSNSKARGIFAPIAKDSFRILTCDGSRINTLQAALCEAKCLPENGFDLVVLRQPDILHRREIFTRMLTEVIPFFSSKTARFFVSCYHQEELFAVAEPLNATGLYCSPGSGNYAMRDWENRSFRIDNQNLSPDKFNVIYHCHGLALAKTISSEPVKELKEPAAKSTNTNDAGTGTGRVAATIASYLLKGIISAGPVGREMKVQMEEAKAAFSLRGKP